MIKKITLIFITLTFFYNQVTAQIATDSIQHYKEYVTLEEALKNPDEVYRLNLSNKKFQIPDSVWAKFSHLEYLSLKNDHLKQIPVGLGSLKMLKVLDLSGNDFKTLPLSFGNLINLQELYLNNDKQLQLGKSIAVLSQLPKLKYLHLENDNLQNLPSNMFKLEHIESLYLNNNKFKRVPTQIQGIKTLKFLDLHDNRYKPRLPKFQDQNFGFIIKF